MYEVKMLLIFNSQKIYLCSYFDPVIAIVIFSF